MIMFTKLIEFNTEYNADSLEWCPIENYHQVFVCGTYQLIEIEDPNKETKQPKKIGKLYLFQINNEQEPLKVLQVIETPAILDTKWANIRIGGDIVLAAANAYGEVSIYSLKEKDDLHLQKIAVYQLELLDGAHNLALSVDWSCGFRRDETNVKLAVSDANGRITILLYQNSSLIKESSWKAHDFEAWIVTFNCWKPNVIYTGGDDAKLKIYDLLVSNDSPVFTSKIHSAGVTSMHCNPLKENLFISGSYDETVHFWDTRNMKKSKNFISTGGGVWRLKWEPLVSRDILAACMYNGFVTIDSETNEILAEYKEHASIAYGVDWCHMDEYALSSYIPSVKLGKPEHTRLVGACSFYDSKLSLALFQR